MEPILTIAIQNSWKQKLFIIFIKRNTSSKSLPFSFTSMKISQKTNFLPRRLRVADDDNQTRQHLQWMMTFFEYCPWLYYFEHFLISTDFRSWTKLKTKPALILDLLSSSIIITIQDQIVSISNTMPMFQMLIWLSINWWTYVIIRILDQFESGVRHVCIFTNWQQLETGLPWHVSCPRHLKLTWIFSSKYCYKYSKSVGKCWCCAM